MADLIIWGCGGHGRVVLDIAREMACFSNVGFYDDSASPPCQIEGIAVFSGGIAKVRRLGFDSFVIAIGVNTLRAKRYLEAMEAGLRPIICRHPTSWISARAEIGPGTVLMPKAVVQTGATVGANCILNTGVIVEHDCVIGDHAHLSPGVALSGGVRVGNYAHMGTGSVALPGAVIGDRSIVGAGAVVLRSVPDGATAIGVPARLLNRERRTATRRDE